MIRTILPSLLVACLWPSSLWRRRHRKRHGGTVRRFWTSPKYPPDFKHFDYVNPNAPKGGLVRLGAQGTFDSFNIVVAGVKGCARTGHSG